MDPLPKEGVIYVLECKDFVMEVILKNDYFGKIVMDRLLRVIDRSLAFHLL